LPQHAATIIQPTFEAAKAQHSSVHRREPESITTKIRSTHAPATERRMSGRIVGILASIVLLLGVAAAVYTFTRQPSTQTPSAETVSLPQYGNPQASYPQNNPVESPDSQPAAAGNTPAATQAKPTDTTAESASNSTGLTPEAERARQADEIRRQRREREEEEIRNKRAEMDREQAREAEMQREREMRRGEPPPPRPGFPPPPRSGSPPPY
jgi:flagellar biosynthesis GTPase FlhF